MGYNRCKDDIEAYLTVPNSLEINDVTCYETVFSEYLISESVHYVYKISYSCENGFGMKLNEVVYYGYNKDSLKVVCYGKDSSVFFSERNVGSEVEIKK